MKKRRIFLIGFALFAVFSFAYIKYYNLNINDIGLKVLSWVKKTKGQSVDLNTIENKNTVVTNHQIWSELLIKHVDGKGKVNYKGFLQDSTKLSAYLKLLSDNPPGGNWTGADKLAYWINAYNAFTVKLIVDNYPLKSIRDISDGLAMINSPWDIKFFKIGNTPFDLNTIEHEILRKQFNEPRIHFAINCASFSCPKLRDEAFTAQALEAQLEGQTAGFINNPDKNSINKKGIRLSKIFNWFESDFTKKTDILSFIQKYRPTLDKNSKVEYLDYN